MAEDDSEQLQAAGARPEVPLTPIEQIERMDTSSDRLRPGEEAELERPGGKREDITESAVPAQPTPFTAKARDLDAIRTAVAEAAGVSGALWLSYLFVFFYFAVAAAGVTHRDLLFENPVKLPFLNVDLPLKGFFALGPLLFLIVHAYVLVHFVMLARKSRVFSNELRRQLPQQDGTRGHLRRQLPINIFVQLLAGPRETRAGIIGFILQSIAWVSLVFGPILLLLFFELQFLPYHDEPITWLQRVLILTDLIVLWLLWPSIVRGKPTWLWLYLRYRFIRRRIALPLFATVLPILLGFIVVTFPGERLHRHLRSMPFVRLMSKSLVDGDVDLVAGRPGSLWSNRLVLPGLELQQGSTGRTTIGSATREVASFRGRSLEGAVFVGARLPKADFTAAKLQEAVFDRADLREAKFECAEPASKIGSNPYLLSEILVQCADMWGTSFRSARLQGASFVPPGGRRTQLRDEVGAQLQGASFEDAHMQGALLFHAHLQGADFTDAQLQGAILAQAQLDGAFFRSAKLQGANFFQARLIAVDLESAVLQGADFSFASVETTSFKNSFVWGAKPPNTAPSRTYFNGIETGKKYPGSDCQEEKCEWSANAFQGLKLLIEKEVPIGDRRSTALRQIAVLDPNNKDNKSEELSKSWDSLKGSTLSSGDYERVLADEIPAIGCQFRIPHVIRGLTRNLKDRISSDDLRGQIAERVLDEMKCYAASYLSELDRTQLMELKPAKR
jgi:uncharacterized protein YjbI with pentapeptide repeats